MIRSAGMREIVHEMSFVYKAVVQDARSKTQRNVSCACLKKLRGLDGFGTHAGCSFQSFTSSAVRPASKMSRLTRDTLPVDYIWRWNSNSKLIIK